VLRRIFGPKTEEVAGGWKRLRNEELHNLYASSYNIRMTKPRWMRWAGYVACSGDMRKAYQALFGNVNGRDYSEDIGGGRRIILELILGK
jgi:hypothetical protein